ncbi:hypothetical protein JKP88DRAFT_223318 [Tribonema minus]|uniref:Uncharacterized protein n=1 Tax=Tribonema minus TaxID=303371 RepID=A0A836CDR6_9STRA|nr:hypothetical protein JKP88DRAFT_223318 [Tribonema minus]
MAFGLRGQDAWRKHPVIANCHKGAFPGFGTAVLIVGAYIAYDQTIKFMNREPQVFAPVTFTKSGDGMPEADRSPSSDDHH